MSQLSQDRQKLPRRSADPCTLLICHALQYICQKDPSWDKAQPREFKAQVVEHLKTQITHHVHPHGTISWCLPIGDKVLTVDAPLFRRLNKEFNPYAPTTQSRRRNSSR